MDPDMNPKLLDFLLRNPHPGMCFLPIILDSGKTVITFFIQDDRYRLMDLVGRIPVRITFYVEGPDLWVMRMDFFFEKTVETRMGESRYLHTESGVAYYETEFRPSIHLQDLQQLLRQDELPVVLFDRRTGYLHTKTVGFRDKRPLRALLEHHA